MFFSQGNKYGTYTMVFYCWLKSCMLLNLVLENKRKYRFRTRLASTLFLKTNIASCHVLVAVAPISQRCQKWSSGLKTCFLMSKDKIFKKLHNISWIHTMKIFHEGFGSSGLPAAYHLFLNVKTCADVQLSNIVQI